MDLNKLGEPAENVASRSCDCSKGNRTWVHLKISSQGCCHVEFWRGRRWCTQQTAVESCNGRHAPLKTDGQVKRYLLRALIPKAFDICPKQAAQENALGIGNLNSEREFRSVQVGFPYPIW